MELQFIKMQGLGNDYVYVDTAVQEMHGIDEPALARAVSARRFSVGADGLIVIDRCPDADVRMRMYNADGSRGEVCGNGLRCVAKYCRDAGIVTGDTVTVLTDAGVRRARILSEAGRAAIVEVEMGRVERIPERIPVAGRDHRFHLTAGDRTFYLFACSVGNPHAVTFLDSLDLDIERYGRIIGSDRIFPAGANVSFVRPLRVGTLQARVWERGSGETLACGSGACAVTAAAIEEGYAEYGMPVRVILPGGVLTVSVRETGEVTQTGEAVTVFSGVFLWEA